MTKKKFKFNPKSPKDSPPPPPVTLPPRQHKVDVHESKGIGDTISKIIKQVSMGKVKECKPCEQRKEKLNKMFPYKNNDK